MAKLTYYYAERLDDAECYSVIAKTLKGAREQVKLFAGAEFGPIEKKELIYRDAFDLLSWAASEGGGRGVGTTIKTYE